MTAALPIGRPPGRFLSVSLALHVTLFVFLSTAARFDQRTITEEKIIPVSLVPLAPEALPEAVQAPPAAGRAAPDRDPGRGGPRRPNASATLPAGAPARRHRRSRPDQQDRTGGGAAVGPQEPYPGPGQAGRDSGADTPGRAAAGRGPGPPMRLAAPRRRTQPSRLRSLPARPSRGSSPLARSATARSSSPTPGTWPSSRTRSTRTGRSPAASPRPVPRRARRSPSASGATDRCPLWP